MHSICLLSLTSWRLSLGSYLSRAYPPLCLDLPCVVFAPLQLGTAQLFVYYGQGKLLTHWSFSGVWSTLGSAFQISFGKVGGWSGWTAEHLLLLSHRSSFLAFMSRLSGACWHPQLIFCDCCTFLWRTSILLVARSAWPITSASLVSDNASSVGGPICALFNKSGACICLGVAGRVKDVALIFILEELRRLLILWAPFISSTWVYDNVMTSHASGYLLPLGVSHIYGYALQFIYQTNFLRLTRLSPSHRSEVLFSACRLAASGRWCSSSHGHWAIGTSLFNVEKKSR